MTSGVVKAASFMSLKKSTSCASVMVLVSVIWNFFANSYRKVVMNRCNPRLGRGKTKS